MNQPQVGFGNTTKPTDEDVLPTKSKIEPKLAFRSVSATGVILDNWKHAKVQYDEAKARLDECKSNVIQHIGEHIDVGTTRFATNHFVLKTTQSIKYDVDGSDINAINQSLNIIAGICGGEVAGSLLKWKPSLNTKVYEQLPPDAKGEIDKFITMSYNTPTLNIEEK